MIGSIIGGMLLVWGFGLIVDAPYNQEDEANPEKDGHLGWGIVMLVAGLLILL